MTVKEGIVTENESRAPVRIRSLAAVLSNQIAAGEVIERPASVVKELLENSLDAAARRIQVEAETGGVGLIRVADDGCGIHPDDLELALSRHATSKIISLTDLERIKSYGFRGEALPSIASVSRLSLKSRTAGSDAGFEVLAEGALCQPPRPAALPEGTVVSVRDLFFNTPARRKFLRSERTEFRHLEEAVRRAALSRFDVGVNFSSNGRELYRLAPATDSAGRKTRIAKLLGSAFADAALEVKIEGPGMMITGWLAAPEAARAHSDLQYLFINGRAVRDSTARHALRQAYGDRLPPGRHPAYLLYLEVDPLQVDVNVHPAKHEVRFREPRLVHDFLWRGLSRALQAEQPRTFADSGAAKAPPTAFSSAKESADGVADTNAFYAAGTTIGTDGAQALQGRSATAAPAVIVGGRYAVVVDPDGAVLVDLAQTRRALIRHQLNESLTRANGVSRPLLLPLTARLQPDAADRLDNVQESLRSAGFDIRRVAPGSLTLRAVPACLAHVPAGSLLDAIGDCVQARTDPPPEHVAEMLANLGGEHLEDLAADEGALTALLRFADRPSGDGRARLKVRLDAAAIAALMRG